MTTATSSVREERRLYKAGWMHSCLDSILFTDRTLAGSTAATFLVHRVQSASVLRRQVMYQPLLELKDTPQHAVAHSFCNYGNTVLFNAEWKNDCESRGYTPP